MPIVLPVVDVTIDDRGELTISIDTEPYDIARNVAPSGRAALGRMLADITAELDSPIRVQVHEADGTVFTDIVTPLREDPSAPPIEPPAPLAAAAPVPAPSVDSHGLGLRVEGFTPGEPVALALVLSHATTDASGTAYVRLPPALLARPSSAVVVLGRQSGLVAFTGDETVATDTSGAA